MNDPTPVVASADVEPVAPTSPAPAQQLVSLTPEQLQALINNAVAAGAAQSGALSAANAAGLPPVPVEVPEVWTVNYLLHALVARAGFHNEREARSAHATVDELFPLEDVEDK